ncbi:MAG: hypothetical protein HC834_02960 [Rhodospirillales bacterium]|nr:hypothetical protein [Rhodospirillales bacterium]
MFRSARLTLAILSLVASFAASTAHAMPIEPRSLTWNIVSDQEMAKICRTHGKRANCEGMAAWDKEFRQCIIWTRSPRSANDVSRWQVVHHELQHCQDGHFHR